AGNRPRSANGVSPSRHRRLLRSEMPSQIERRSSAILALAERSDIESGLAANVVISIVTMSLTFVSGPVICHESSRSREGRVAEARRGAERERFPRVDLH